MSKGKAAVGLVIGAILIYLGIFGLTAPAYAFQITGDIVQADWNTLTGWVKDTGTSGLAAIEPAGQLHTKGGGVYRRDITCPTKFIVEFKMKIDDYGNSYATFQVYTTNYFHCLRIWADRIQWSSNQPSNYVYNVATDLNWHVWKVSIDVDSGLVVISRDGVILTQTTQFYSATGLTPQITVGCGRDTTTEAHWDYFYIGTSEAPPPPPPETGTVHIYAYYNGYVSTTMTIAHPDGTIETATTPYHKDNLPYGTYTISCPSYNAIPSTNSPHTFTLSSSHQTESFTFAFQDSEPPPNGNGGTDPFQWLSALFENPVLKSILLISGIGTTGASFIVLLMPRKKMVYSPL